MGDRIVVVLGGIVLGLSLRLEPGSIEFYGGVARRWPWCGRPGRSPPARSTSAGSPATTIHVRPVLTPILIGLALAGVFVVGGLVVRQIPFLADQVGDVVDFADEGAIPMLVLITAINGVAEELFFRGAAYAATPRHPVLVTTVALHASRPTPPAT